MKCGLKHLLDMARHLCCVYRLFSQWLL